MKLFILLSLLAEAAFAKPATVIDFEGDVVEGLNKRPLDSVSQLSERNKGDQDFHVYRKRKGFDSETRVLLRDLDEGGEPK